MTERPNPYPLRLEKDVMEKSKIIAKENGRSLNKEIEFVLRKYIANYEKANGAIELPSPGEDI